MQAQKHGKRSVPSKVTKTEKTPADRLFETMVEGTAKVMFIDSIVVDKKNFLSKIPMSKDAGTLSEQNGQSSYTNELGNHRIYADGDTVQGYHLYSTDLLGDIWSKPKQLVELDEEVDNVNYPFLLSDGMTLFFSGQGEKSLGGYDIFMTLFNNEDGTFYKPENYGLPFNSTANDYLLAIDDMYALGWLVSDRYQPEGKVCIYTFVPTMPRLNFSQDNLSEEQLKSFAKLTSIKDTWAFGNRDTALRRLESLKQNNNQANSKPGFLFPVNDKIVYTKIDDFKSNKTKELYTQLTEMKSQLSQNEKTLAKMRFDYSRASISDQQGMRANLLKAEETIQQQRKDVQTFEKSVRNEENKLLTN
ncbi:hypothetical protein HMPREF0650_0715 [Hoylesella buccalis ATCC 35310]|uniref:WD40-like protein n=2 Tax=Hoylesella buccalis TaxID=28127 RepID=D1W551_9BACT|nr:hypothetical protein HMPREF0650_0715 [Hoylesella buccalis ATCC 35310]